MAWLRDGWTSELEQNDREVALKAVREDGSALQWAGEVLKADRDIVMAAVTNRGWNLKWNQKKNQILFT
eukprot:2826638-Amphidinium_carterae.1